MVHDSWVQMAESTLKVSCAVRATRNVARVFDGEVSQIPGLHRPSASTARVDQKCHVTRAPSPTSRYLLPICAGPP